MVRFFEIIFMWMTIISKILISNSDWIDIQSGWMQGHNRKIFLRGQSNFSWFFSQHEMHFPGRNFHFGRPKTNFSVFWKVRRRKKKRSSPHFVTFPPSIFNFPPSLLQFSFLSSQFSPLFPFFLASFIPVGQQKLPGQKFLGALCPSPLLRHYPHLTV